jgi:hypothetical protein
VVKPPLVGSSIQPDMGASASKPKRPSYFVVLTTLVSMIGLFGWTDGCEVIRALHNPTKMKIAAERIPDLRWSPPVLDALVAIRSQALPMAIADLLLGILLWLTAIALLFGRSQVRALLMQVLGAYAVFLCISHVLYGPLRVARLDAVVSAGLPKVEGHSPEEVASAMRTLGIWFEHGKLVVKLAILAGGAVAMTRPRVRAWLGLSGPRTTNRPGP